MKSITTPLTEETMRSLSLGETVLLSGRIFTARDAAHQYIMAHAELEPPCPDLRGGVLYHCGPVIVRQPNQDGGDGWLVTAAGPTTSSREEPYEAQVIERFGLRAIIGKGGMGADTLEACRRCGCVYLQATGGAAQVLAEAVQQVTAVYYYEQFGAPEAIWEFNVKDFPATVTMDAHGHSLHADIRQTSADRLAELLN